MLMRRLAFILSMATTVVAPGFAASGSHETWTETCAETLKLHDGDTFTCVPTPGSGRSAFIVRPAGVDAPETGQAYWKVARERLRALAGPGTQVACYKADRHEREVCRVRGPGGEDVAETLIREGLGMHFVQFVGEETTEEQVRYAEAERQARDTKAGLWAAADPQAPWNCRRLKREHGHCH